MHGQMYGFENTEITDGKIEGATFVYKVASIKYQKGDKTL